MSVSFTEEQKEYIKSHVIGRTSLELANLFNNKFNEQITVKKIQQYKKSHKLKSGINTKFKKNQIPHNYKPIGSEFINSNGYVLIKVKNPNSWQLKHRYIYEKYKGKIPDGYSVIFADSNKRNFDLDNLILAEVKDKLVAKNKHLIFDDKELTKVGLTIAKLINKTKEVKKINAR